MFNDTENSVNMIKQNPVKSCHTLRKFLKDFPLCPAAKSKYNIWTSKFDRYDYLYCIR